MQCGLTILWLIVVVIIQDMYYYLCFIEEDSEAQIRSSGMYIISNWVQAIRPQVLALMPMMYFNFYILFQFFNFPISYASDLYYLFPLSFSNLEDLISSPYSYVCILQSTLNSKAKVIIKKYKTGYATQYLLISLRIKTKVVLVAYNAIHNLTSAVSQISFPTILPIVTIVQTYWSPCCFLPSINTRLPFLWTQ